MNNSDNIEKLEGIIFSYLNTSFKEIPPTEEEFYENARNLREANKNLIAVTDKEFEEILVRLRKNIVVQIDVGIYIHDPNNGHQSWLPAKRADIDFFFWNRYKKYLQEVKHWNPRMTTTLGTDSDNILDLCGDPSEERFAIKGLILGDVQSGKTANYTALCNKAADVGYKIIIILAGMQENLRKQTQERLDAECTGRRSDFVLDPNAQQKRKNTPVGVGRIASGGKIVAFTSVTNDFDSGILRSNNLGIENVNCPVILVVKKNKRILNNLITWLFENNTLNTTGQIDLPLMLIDDEADNASPNTNDKDSQPTAINNCIRSLLNLFSRTTYLGITATPFANIFIDPGEDDNLFPADFIYSLSPPDNYIGPDRMFGNEGDFTNVLQTIDNLKFLTDFPQKHKKDYLVQHLPDDLYEAVYYFLLVNAIRDFRGDNTEHRSMMIHVSLYNNVQLQVVEILRIWLEQVSSDLRNYAALPLEKAEQIENIRKLHNVWDKFDLTSISHIEWADLLRKYLYRAVAPIDVRAVNMKTGAASLDYYNHKKDGLRVIAVGGNSLSRGLTLEGLCVSYFHRNTKMYDTLLQMGRWFGYRPNYDDLIKVWITQETIDWYSQITLATEELKDDIAKMKRAGQTPREFGLKVRQDPGSLIVTARNKMRTAEKISCPITVSGHLLETPRLKASQNILDENERAFKHFVNLLASKGDRLLDEERTNGNYYWEHVDSELISQLVLNFDTNPWHLSYNRFGLADYINSHQWVTGWDVVLFNNGEGSPYEGEINCGKEILPIAHTERRKIIADDKMISVSGTKVRVGAGGCTKVGLTKDQIKTAEEKFKRDTGKKNISDKTFLIEDRAPILMLHIIQGDYTDSPNQNLPRFLFALGVGFPEVEGNTETANYMVNIIELRNWSDIYDDTDEEDTER